MGTSNSVYRALIPLDAAVRLVTHQKAPLALAVWRVSPHRFFAAPLAEFTANPLASSGGLPVHGRNRDLRSYDRASTRAQRGRRSRPFAGQRGISPNPRCFWARLDSSPIEPRLVPSPEQACCGLAVVR